MRRYALVLLLLAAVALLCALVFLSMDEGGETAPPDVPAPVVPAPKPSKALPAPAPRTAPAPAADPVPETPPAPILPVGRGRLQCGVGAYRPGVKGVSVRLSVLWPTGEEIASASVQPKKEHTFTNLPHEVPLVLCASADGFLTGLCCDIEIGDGGLVQKWIEMLPAPVVTVRVQAPQDRGRYEGVGVDVYAGAGLVASGQTSEDDGEVSFRSDVAGRLRLRVSGGPFATPREFVRDVWPTADGSPVLVVVEVAKPETVEILVVDADGRPAPSVPVWLAGELSPRAPKNTDREGVVVFEGVERSNVLTALARAANGLVAGATVGARRDSSGRICLYLAKPQPLKGDVVDEGGSVIVGAKVEVVVRPFDEPVTVTSDDTGRFETPPLPAGLADVVARKSGFLDWRAAQPVVIVKGEGGGVRARMTRAPTGRVFVRVRDESGSPVAGATVTLHPSRLTKTTLADGTCRIDDVPAPGDETVFVRSRGYVARRDAAWSPRIVRIQENRGVDAEIVLAKRGTDEPPPGGGALSGTVLDPRGGPVVAAAVECGRIRAFTNADGRFRLDGIGAAATDEPLECRILPGPGLLEPLRFHVDAADLGAADMGQVRLRSRPFARIVVPPGPSLVAASDVDPKAMKRSRPSGSPSPAFWLASNHADVFLGVRHDAFEPYACVSYDGTWLHLPPADDWRADGRGEVFVAYPSWRGLMTANASWTLAPDAAADLRPAFEHSNGRVSVDARGIKKQESVRFEQTRCGTLFDPRSIHVPTGNEQEPRDPFASLASFRTFTIERAGANLELEDVAPGQWRVVAGESAAWATVPGSDRVVFAR